jgi:DNA recombination protein RmuC
LENKEIVIIGSVLFVVFLLVSFYLITMVKNHLLKIKESIDTSNKESELNDQQKDSEFKQDIKNELHLLKDGLKDSFNRDIMSLNKEVNQTMLSNVEKSQTTANSNLKEISEVVSNSLKQNKEELDNNMTLLQKEVSDKLENITEKVENKLSGGFDKSNEIFNKIINKINLIEEAQNTIENLSKNVTDLQNVLSDKQSRGAWGEVQLEQIIGNTFPTKNYETQYKLSNNTKVDFLLRIPDPSFDICIDSKFPFENYKRMVSEKQKELRVQYSKKFKTDVKKHIDDIASKYIIIGETADYALMFLPAEAVFSEIHSYHYDLVEYSQKKKVILVSPTTMTAILTTAYSVIKDDSMKRQLTKIKSALGALYKDFDRLENRMGQLKSNVSKVNEDIEGIDISSRKINNKFKNIQSLEFDDKSDKDEEDKILIEDKKSK